MGKSLTTCGAMPVGYLPSLRNPQACRAGGFSGPEEDQGA